MIEIEHGNMTELPRLLAPPALLMSGNRISRVDACHTYIWNVFLDNPLLFRSYSPTPLSDCRESWKVAAIRKSGITNPAIEFGR
jgi:hypothetical protein